MIVSRLFCGLANQMFQYAAGLALAQRRNTVLKLDVSWFSEGNAAVAHERYGLDCFVLDAHFATEQELAWCRGHQRNVAESRFARLLENIGLRRYAELLPAGGDWHIQKQFNFYPEFFDLPDGCVIDGTFQSEKFFTPVSKILKKHFGFRFAPSSKVAALAQEIQGCEAVAVHFRRGDLLTSSKSTQDPVEEGYYRTCMELLGREVHNPKYFVFSDDVEFARGCGICPEGSVFVDCVEPWNAYDDIRLMSLCRHFIIANSSFSWWGAWLSGNERKMVFRPEPWFTKRPQHNLCDVCPDSWMAIPRSGKQI